MPELLDLELGKTAHVVIGKICKVKPHESVLITIDGLEEFRVAEEIAKAAEAAEAKVIGSVAFDSSRVRKSGRPLSARTIVGRNSLHGCLD